jgi:hypothetical protein
LTDPHVFLFLDFCLSSTHVGTHDIWDHKIYIFNLSYYNNLLWHLNSFRFNLWKIWDSFPYTDHKILQWRRSTKLSWTSTNPWDRYRLLEDPAHDTEVLWASYYPHKTGRADIEARTQ